MAVRVMGASSFRPPTSTAIVTGLSRTRRTAFSVEIRQDVASALLTSVRVRQDKTVQILPRWGEALTVTFTKRGSVPHLPTR